MLSGPEISRPSSVIMPNPSVPGTRKLTAEDSGLSTRFLKSVMPKRNEFVKRGVRLEPTPGANWWLILLLKFPGGGRRSPPKPPKLLLSLRLQRKKKSFRRFTL